MDDTLLGIDTNVASYRRFLLYFLYVIGIRAFLKKISLKPMILNLTFWIGGNQLQISKVVKLVGALLFLFTSVEVGRNSFTFLFFFYFKSLKLEIKTNKFTATNLTILVIC